MFEEWQGGDETERGEFGSGGGGFWGGFGLLVGIFEVGAFFDDILHHAAEKVGLEGAELILRSALDTDFDANSVEGEGILEIGRGDKIAGAVEIGDPAGVGVAGLDELGGGVGGEGLQGALDSFQDFAILLKHGRFFVFFGVGEFDGIFFGGEGRTVRGGASDDIRVVESEF